MTEVTWSIDDRAGSADVVLVTADDEPNSNLSDGSSKSITAGWPSFSVSVDSSGNVVIDPSAVGTEITYTLTASTVSAVSGYTIADTLAEGMTYVDGSFTATIETWDADGLNRTEQSATFDPTVSGNSFAGSLDLPGNSKATVTYQATITQEAVDALEATLQQQYDAYVASGKTDASWISANLSNTAVFNGDATHTATVSAGYSIPGVAKPQEGQGMTKSTSLAEGTTVATNEDGSLAEPLAITYTLGANLSQWDGSSANYTLDSNVVITDTLPDSQQWLDSDSDFLVASSTSNSGVTQFQRIESCPSATDFAPDAYVGTYCVDGQTLLINVGKDASTNLSIAVHAQLISTAGLPTGWTNISSAVAYSVQNIAVFSYEDGTGSHTPGRSTSTNIVDLGDTSEGVDNPNVFSKTVAQADQQIVISKGETAQIPYTFTINGVDVSQATITDAVDTNVFDVSDGAMAVTGQYAYWINLTAADFTVTVTDDGEISIQLSEAGIQTLQANGQSSPFTERLTVTLTLTTNPVQGKQTLEITNSATLSGANQQLTYRSSTSSSVTTYGDEAEVEKDIYNSTNETWVTSLSADYADGTLTDTTYVYRLSFIPHGSYTQVAARSVTDTLPDGLEFVGFVSASDVTSESNATLADQYLSNNLIASYDADSNTITVAQRDGTVLQSTNPSYAYLLVRVADPTSPDVIVNTFGNASATIVPAADGEYPLTIAKKDAENSNTVITDHSARFQVLGSDKETVVVDNIYVDNGYLMVGDTSDPQAITVTTPGTYWVKEIVAPSGYEASEDLYKIVVAEDGTSSVVTIFDEPAASSSSSPSVAPSSSAAPVSSGSPEPSDSASASGPASSSTPASPSAPASSSAPASCSSTPASSSAPVSSEPPSSSSAPLTSGSSEPSDSTSSSASVSSPAASSDAGTASAPASTTSGSATQDATGSTTSAAAEDVSGAASSSTGAASIWSLDNTSAVAGLGASVAGIGVLVTALGGLLIGIRRWRGARD